jgi:hypothetical protein
MTTCSQNTDFASEGKDGSPTEAATPPLPIPDIPMANPRGRGVHSANPDAQTGPTSQIGYCGTCGWAIKLVPGGHGPTWVHEATKAVVGSGTGPMHPSAPR